MWEFSSFPLSSAEDLTTQILQVAAILLFQLLFPVSQRLWFENAEFPFVLPFAIGPQDSSEVYQYIATGIKNSWVYSPKQYLFSSSSTFCSCSFVIPLTIPSATWISQILWWYTHAIFHVLTAILYVILFNKCPSNDIMVSPFQLVWGSWHEDEQKRLERCAGRAPWGRLFPGCSQHLTACWKGSLVITCNWKVILLFLIFLIIIKLSLLLSCHF